MSKLTARFRYAIRCWLANRRRCSVCTKDLNGGPEGWEAPAIAHIAGMTVCARHGNGREREDIFERILRDADIVRGFAALSEEDR